MMVCEQVRYGVDDSILSFTSVLAFPILTCQLELDSILFLFWCTVWALGIVAGDSPKCGDLVLANGALLPLLAQLNERAELSMLTNARWTLSNFRR